jgi:GcrA cell cycle regulator
MDGAENKHHGSPPWPADLADLLREMWADNTLSTRAIARRLCVSRNAVIGKAHRLGLPGRVVVVTVRKARDKTVVIRKPWRPAEPPPPEQVGIMPLEFLNRRLEDLQRLDCRWPQGDWPPYLYCGQPAHNGSCYCVYHHAIACVPRDRKSKPFYPRVGQ